MTTSIAKKAARCTAFCAAWLISLPASAAQQLPNLQAFPAEDIVMAENFGGVLELRFSARIWNSGAGPLELIAGEVSRGQQNVYQRIYSDDGSYQDELAGSFVWHQGHDHFHFEDFAVYTLQPVKGNSKRSSAKTSFCLMDSAIVDGQLPGAPNSPAYANCGNFFQGISVGWADVYGSELPGQSIDLSRLKDGEYRLIIEADPRRRLVESDDSDNESCVLLDIRVSTQTLTILDPTGCNDSGNPPPAGEVTLTGISPNATSVDQAVSVVITGTGFTDGAEVSFSNGEGSKPTASDVVVVSDTEIHATVTVKRRGGNKPDNVWDLNVDSGSLADAFTVLP